MQLSEDGRGGGHPSYMLGYYDAPSLEPQVHEFVTWLNSKDTIGFNTASLAPVANYNRKGRAMAFTGPGIACDWLDIEGPMHDVWPPVESHVAVRRFAARRVQAGRSSRRPTPPQRKLLRQEIGAAKNRPDPPAGIWTVQSDQPLVDADRLLATFLPQAFRRPVPSEVRQSICRARSTSG